MILIQLFFEFFRTGLFSVGGGMATLPFLYDISDRTGWYTHQQLVDLIAVSESTPGPIGINMATYVGYLTAGVPGSIIASLGLVTPSVIIILIVATFLKAFRDSKYVNGAFYGLRPASAALITAAWLVLIKITFLLHEGKGLKLTGLFAALNYKAIVLAAAILLVTHGIKQTKNLHPIIWIGCAALVGIIFKF